MKIYKFLFPLFILSLVLGSCKKFLEEKESSKQSLITSPEDCQMVLNSIFLNQDYPADGELSADAYFLTDENWSSITDAQSRDFYIWAPNAQRTNAAAAWLSPYNVVYTANVVLDALAKMNPNTDAAGYKLAKGNALFLRAYAFYSVASLYTKPYSVADAGQDPGIPLRLVSDINVVAERGTVKQTYDQIIADFKEAADLLPTASIVPTRPSKRSAYAALARVYLAMEDYPAAGTAANTCLQLKPQIQNDLLNFSQLNTSGDSPFKRFNTEVLFHVTTAYEGLLDTYYTMVSTDLYDSYDDNDLRKQAYFKSRGDGSYTFKVGYSEDSYYTFNGLALDEVYLIRAESYARANQPVQAMKDLNDLLRTRWKVILDPPNNPVTTYQDMTASSAEDALKKVLEERKKELVFRGTRWTDLRRLNKDSRFAEILSRTINGTVYTLSPKDLRYTLLIPLHVIQNTNFTQNPR